MFGTGVLVVLVTASAAWWAWGFWCERWPKRFFPQRPDHQALWMAAFSVQDRARVDALLTAICDALLIRPQYRFRLRPSDDFHEFYRRNMRGALADSLEHIFLMRALENDLDIPRDVARDAVIAQPCTVGSLARLVARPLEALAFEPDPEADAGP